MFQMAALRVLFLLMTVILSLFVGIQSGALTPSKSGSIKCPTDKTPIVLGTAMVCVPKNYTLPASEDRKR